MDKQPPTASSRRSVASFRTTQTYTPNISRESSPYFCTPTQGLKSIRSNPSRATYLTITPQASSPVEITSTTEPTSSYDYDDTSSQSTQTPQEPSQYSFVSRPGTSQTSRTTRLSLPDSENHKIVCALSEARGVTPSVGMASINSSTGEVILSQISDSKFFTRTIHKLQILEPSIILIVASSCPPNPKSRLYSHVEENMPGIKIAPFDRRYWSEMEGIDRIDACAFREDAAAIKVALNGSYYATCSFAAAISFLETQYSLRIFPNSLRVRYQPCEDTMMIDVSTIISIEILQNLGNPRSKDSLLGLLKQTRTPMGARLLRSNLLQPSTLKELFIDPRYDAVEELLQCQDIFIEVRKALIAFPDVERMLTQLVIVPRQPTVAGTESLMNNILKVKTFVDAVPNLYEALSSATSPLLLKILQLLRPHFYTPVRDMIYQTIHQDVSYSKRALDQRNQRTFAVKSGVNGLLDVARQTYKENTEEVHKHVSQLYEEYGIEAKIQYDSRRGYSLRVREVDFEDRSIPAILVNRTTRKGTIECTTIRLKQLNQRITDSTSEVIMQSDQIIQDLTDSIRTQIAPLYRMCESIALLDMLASFAQASSIYDWVRPCISDTLALEAARHPILDKMLKEECVPNDYYASDDYRFQVITGCNMSGKTIYIKSIAMLQIMAQIGCFVPAKSANFPIIHSIFARVSIDDRMESNLSSFSLEMREMAFILRNVNNKSMVIIDELGRSTSTQDGLGIAIAMAEALVQSRALVWFTTHFAELADVLNDRPGVLNLHLASDMSTTENGNPKLTMTYKVESGKVDQILYGITLAKAMGFPQRFLEVAEHVSLSIREKRLRNQQSSKARKIISERKLILNLHAQLKQAHQSDMDDETLLSYLKRLQAEFIERMSALHDGENHVTETGTGNSEIEDNATYEDDDVFDAMDVETLSLGG
ncbi:DNA mismatch repair protein [Colletotrichum truncatum]|uniref:DNA mismatch repair protein n=1 Tax=Colletotrichum truncatum TaxID=5467 RepID=A0ACC3Z2U9_COLTU|nr:DNA mismatch repair protein [Colletotrichum truncatum]KAF6793270.1 DNA mismatch repair protein [Colletotrichum truncatum]